MIFKLIFFTILFGISGCDSPRAKMVRADIRPYQDLSQTLLFQNYNLNARFIWVEGPYPEVFKSSKLMVLIYNNEGQLVDLPDGLNLSFFSIMPSMGHGPDDPGYFERLSAGVYLNPSIVFQMAGDWQMELTIMDVQYKELDRVLWIEFF